MKLTLKQKQKLNEFWDASTAAAGYVFITIVAGLIVLGNIIWKQSQLDVSQNLILTWTWGVVMLFLIAFLIYGVFLFRKINNYHLLAAMLLVVIPFTENPSFILRVSYFVFGVGFFVKVLEIVLERDIEEYILTKTIKFFTEKRR